MLGKCLDLITELNVDGRQWRSMGGGILGIFRSTFHSFLDRPEPVLLGVV